MPRAVRDTRLESRSARAALKVAAKPYYRSIDPGLHIGYRKSKTGGRWVARLYLGRSEYRLITLDALADDKQDADGQSVLNFAQAQEKVRAFYKEGSRPSPLAGRMTVRQACDEYVEYLKAERKTGEESEGRLAKHIYPVLGDKLVAQLTTPDVERCKRGMVRKDAQNSDVERASKDSANRVLAMLRAALNRAFEDERNGIPSDAAWRRVKQFRGVGRARQVHLDVNESIKLIGLCDGAFRNLVTATLITGARAPHELAQRFVRDFSYSLGTLSVFDGKTGSREIVLTQEGIEFFRQITDGRDGSEILLPKDDGTLWGKNHHIKLMKRAVKAAGLPAKCTIYSLRHTYASQSILAGMNLKLLAENMGTSIRMLEIHYGKFIAASRQKLVEQSAFKLGLATLAKRQASAA